MEGNPGNQHATNDSGNQGEGEGKGGGVTQHSLVVNWCRYGTYEMWRKSSSSPLTLPTYLPTISQRFGISPGWGEFSSFLFIHSFLFCVFFVCLNGFFMPYRYELGRIGGFMVQVLSAGLCVTSLLWMWGDRDFVVDHGVYCLVFGISSDRGGVEGAQGWRSRNFFGDDFHPMFSEGWKAFLFLSFFPRVTQFWWLFSDGGTVWYHTIEGCSLSALPFLPFG